MSHRLAKEGKAVSGRSIVHLPPPQIQMIEEALPSIGDLGGIVQKGRLRFLVIKKSLEVPKWQPETSQEQT